MTPTPLIFTYWKHLIESFCKVTWQICFWKLIDIDAEMYVCVCLCLCVGLSVGMRHWVWVCVCVCVHVPWLRYKYPSIASTLRLAECSLLNVYLFTITLSLSLSLLPSPTISIVSQEKHWSTHSSLHFTFRNFLSCKLNQTWQITKWMKPFFGEGIGSEGVDGVG